MNILTVIVDVLVIECVCVNVCVCICLRISMHTPSAWPGGIIPVCVHDPLLSVSRLPTLTHTHSPLSPQPPESTGGRCLVFMVKESH